MIRLFKGLFHSAMKHLSNLTPRLSVPNFGEAPKDTAIFEALRQERGIRIKNERAGQTPIDKPFFRFNPRAYELDGTFVESTEICDVCDQDCVWEYDSSLYAAVDDFTMCARCIFEGRISDVIKDKHFSFNCLDISGVDAELRTELEQRTPGFATYNPFQWPVLDGMPLAFIGYGEEAVIVNDTKAQLAIAAAFAHIYDDHEVYEVGTPNHYALVFKEISGDRYMVEKNFD
jgi:uncharacterized protein